jgi:hypothetical protein
MLQGDARQDRALEVSLVRHGDDGSPAAICAAKKPLATSAKCLRDAQSELSGDSPSTAMNCNAICDSSATDSRSQNRSLTQSRSHARSLSGKPNIHEERDAKLISTAMHPNAICDGRGQTAANQRVQ